jgi:hypothetical protein
MKKVNRAEVGNGQLKVWCGHCSIRIAPNESSVASDGKIYHQHCYERYCAAEPKMGVAPPRWETVLGREK